MYPFSWNFLCSKKQWLLNLFTTNFYGTTKIYVKKILFFLAIVFKEPKQTRVVGAREDVHHETPLTILIGRYYFKNGEVVFKGLAVFQPQELIVITLIVFIVCLYASLSFIESIGTVLLASIAQEIAITINCKNSLIQKRYVIEEITKNDSPSPLP